MGLPFVEKVIAALQPVAECYFRLLVVVAPPGAGKSATLVGVQEQIAAPLLNVSLELSARLLELTSRQRKIQVARILDDIVTEQDADIVLLDNIEVLFDVSLEQEPLGLLQRLSRNRTVVVAWNGAWDGDAFVYASPEHAEYKRYQVRDFMVVTP